MNDLMRMDKFLEILRKKPLLFFVISLGYLMAVGFLKWGTSPPWGALWFMAGAILGIYFLDAAEVFFHLVPSPFRSIIFAAGFVLVSFFVVTSSGSLLASGLVLSLYLTMILWQIGQWRVAGNLDSWYQMIAGGVGVKTQLWLLTAFALLFFIETYLFIR